MPELKPTLNTPEECAARRAQRFEPGAKVQVANHTSHMNGLVGTVHSLYEPAVGVPSDSHRTALYHVELHETGVGKPYLDPDRQRRSHDFILISSMFLLPYVEPAGWAAPFDLTWDGIGGQSRVGPFDIVIVNDSERLVVSAGCQEAYWIPKEQQ